MADEYIEKINCPVCGSTFETPYIFKVYCSSKCRYKAYRMFSSDERQRFLRKPGDFECGWCGKKVRTTEGDKRTKFCSSECCEKFWKHPRLFGTGTMVVHIPQKYNLVNDRWRIFHRI